MRQHYFQVARRWTYHFAADLASDFVPDQIPASEALWYCNRPFHMTVLDDAARIFCGSTLLTSGEIRSNANRFQLAKWWSQNILVGYSRCHFLPLAPLLIGYHYMTNLKYFSLHQSSRTLSFQDNFSDSRTYLVIDRNMCSWLGRRGIVRSPLAYIEIVAKVDKWLVKPWFISDKSRIQNNE